MKHISGNKRGYLLPMVIIYMIIAMIVGAGIMVLGSLDRIEANKRLHREQAFYLAEAGVNYARYQLKSNGSSWVPPTNPYILQLAGATGTDSFFVDNITSDTMIIVTSTGTVKGEKETVVINLTKGSGTFSHGVFGNSDVYLHNNALIDSYDSRLGAYTFAGQDHSHGDVASDNIITVDNNAILNGDATGGSSIVDPKDGITGIETLNDSHRTPLAPVVIPDDLLNHTPYLIQGASEITVQAGSYTLSGGKLSLTNNSKITISGGNFRFNEFNTSNNSTVTVIGTIRFYVENKFYLDNNSTFTLPGGELYIGTSGTITVINNSVFQNLGTAADLGIYIASTKDQTFENNSSAFSAAIYAPLATINFSNNSIFYGDVVANEVMLSNNAKLHYDVALKDIKPPGDTSSGTPRFISWTKPFWKIK